MNTKIPTVAIAVILSLAGAINFANAQVTTAGHGGCGIPGSPCLDFIAMPVGAGELPPDLAQNILFTGDGSVRTFAGSLLTAPKGVFLGSSALGQQLYKHLKLNFKFGGGIDLNSKDSFNFFGSFLAPGYDVIYSGTTDSFNVDLDAGNKVSLPVGSFAQNGQLTDLLPVYGILSINPSNPGSPANARALADSIVTVTGSFNSINATPEPGAFALLGTALVGGGLTFWRYKRKR